MSGIEEDAGNGGGVWKNLSVMLFESVSQVPSGGGSSPRVDGDDGRSRWTVGEDLERIQRFIVEYLKVKVKPIMENNAVSSVGEASPMWTKPVEWILGGAEKISKECGGCDESTAVVCGRDPASRFAVELGRGTCPSVLASTASSSSPSSTTTTTMTMRSPGRDFSAVNGGDAHHPQSKQLLLGRSKSARLSASYSSPLVAADVLSPMGSKLSAISDAMKRLRQTYKDKTHLESKTVKAIFDEIDTLVSDGMDLEGKVRSHRYPDAPDQGFLVRVVSESNVGRPLVYLDKDLVVMTPFNLASTAKAYALDRAIPLHLFGRIDSLYYDVKERCCVVADVVTIPMRRRAWLMDVDFNVENVIEHPMEYRFLKRWRVVKLQLLAAMLEQISNGDLRVGYVMIVAFDPNVCGGSYRSWRIKFDPAFFLATTLCNSHLFYSDQPRPFGTRSPSTSRSFDDIRIAPDVDMFVSPRVVPMPYSVLTTEELEGMLPHRCAEFCQASPTTGCKSRK